MKKLLLLLTLFTCPILSFSQDWRDVGNTTFPEATDVHLTVDSEGTPYIAYADGGTGFANVKYWDGSEWIDLPEPLSNISLDVRITSAGTDIFVGLFDVNSFEYRVYKLIGGAWTQLGDLTLMSYDMGQIDLNATEMGVNDVQVFFKDTGTGNGTTWSYVDGLGTWNLFATPDFLSTSSTPITVSHPFLEDNNSQTCVLTQEEFSGSDLRFYRSNGGSWENLLYEGSPFIVSTPYGFGMDVRVAMDPLIAVVAESEPDSIQLYTAELGTAEITKSYSYGPGENIAQGKFGMTVNSLNEVITVYTTASGTVRSAYFSGGSWADLGSDFPETELGDFELASNLNSTKPYVIYKTDGNQAGVKAYNYVPVLAATPTVLNICNGGGSQNVIPSIQFNDTDKDSVYLRISSSDVGVIPNANITITPLSGYDFTSVVNSFTIDATPLTSGSTDLTIHAIDGLDTLTQMYSVEVYAEPVYTPAGNNPTTCAGNDGSIDISGLSLSHTYDIGYDDDASAEFLSAITTDGGGNYNIPTLNAGAYDNWSITDGVTGCVGTNATLVELADPASPSPSLSTFADPTTCGGVDGSITFFGVDPSTSFDVTFDKDGSGDSFSGTSDAGGYLEITGLGDGAYDNFNVTDPSTLCSGSDASTITLTDPFTPTPVYAFSSNPSTCGGTDGSVTLSGMDLSTSYNVTYDKDGSGDSFTGTTDATGYLEITGLGVGVYDNFVVTDPTTTCSGSESSSATLSEPAPPSFTAVTSSDPTVCGASDGSIDLTGLSTSYTYNVSYDLGSTVSAGAISSDISGNLTIPGLGVGTYDSIAITDPSTMCTGYEAVVSTFVLTDPSSPTFTVATTSTSICGGSDGTAVLQGLPVSTSFTSLDFDYEGVADAVVSPISNAAGEIPLGLFAAGTIDNIILVDVSSCSGTDGGFHTILSPAGPSVNAGSDITICEEELIVLNADNPDDAVISWDNGVEDGEEFTLPSGTYTITATATAGLCSSVDDMELIVYPKPILSTLTTLATCGSEDGAIDATISGGLPPYEIYWSNGATTEDISGLTATAYYLNVTDDNGCYSMEVATIELTTLTVGVSETPILCKGAATGAIDLTVTGTGPFTYYWSNGETTEDISGLTAGEYEVFVTDASDCLSSTSIVLSEPTKLKSTFTSIEATCGSSDGSIAASPTGGVSPYSFQWFDDAATAIGIDDETLGTIEAGSYSVEITDANGCTSTFNTTLSDVGAPNVVIESVTPASCSNDGAMDITATPIGTALVDSYVWSSGEFTEDASSKAAGYYSVQVMDDSGCMTAKGMVIPAIKPDVQQICIVGVDTATNTNRIVWEKPVSTTIDHYDIYRESSVAGLFQYVNSQDYATESFFVDSIAYPQLRSWRYKMKTVNTCGIESDMSIEHKTIHIVYDETTPGNFTLNWDAYEGFAYSEYRIWRFLPAAGWVLIGSQSTALPPTLMDTPPSTVGIDYIIEVVPPSSCVSTGKATDHNSSRSNKTSNNPITPGGTAVDDLGTNEIQTVNYSIYPNPSTGLFNLVLESTLNIQAINIYDLSGKQTIVEFDNSSTNIQIDLTNAESGVYLLEVLTEKGTINHKLIKN